MVGRLLVHQIGSVGGPLTRRLCLIPVMSLGGALGHGTASATGPRGVTMPGSSASALHCRRPAMAHAARRHCPRNDAEAGPDGLRKHTDLGAFPRRGTATLP